MKIMKKILLLAMTSCILLQLAACSKSSGPVIEITLDDYNTVLEQTKVMYKNQVGEDTWESKLKDDKAFNERLEELVVEQVVLEKVLLTKAAEAKTTVADEEVTAEVEKIKKQYTTTEEYNKFLEENNYTEETLINDIKQQLEIQSYLRTRAEEIMKYEPTEKELKATYEKYKDTFIKRRASHILVGSEEQAKDIKARLDKGEDFATLAKEVSTCPSSEQGGDLGYFAEGDMVKEFSDAAFALALNEISVPVKSQFGYHIIKITEIQDKYENTNVEDIKYQYRSEKYNEMIENFVKDANLKLPKELEEIRKRSNENNENQ